MTARETPLETPGAVPEVSGHTPGPWEVDRYPDGRALVFCAKFENSHYGDWIADISGIADGGSKQKANARLIAAAPELLEALEACVTQLLLHGWNDPADGLKSCAALVKARAALAKAKGAA